MTDAYNFLIKVNVLPSKRQRFTTPQAERNGKKNR